MKYRILSFIEDIYIAVTSPKIDLADIESEPTTEEDSYPYFW